MFFQVLEIFVVFVEYIDNVFGLYLVVCNFVLGEFSVYFCYNQVMYIYILCKCICMINIYMYKMKEINEISKLKNKV